jgi:hypothetical protein
MEVFLVGTAGHECATDQVSLFLEHASFSGKISKI